MGFLYVFLAVIATGTFARKMVQFTAMRSNDSVSGDDLKLNKQQMKMIDSTTRYCSLLHVGILTSLFATVVMIIIGDDLRKSWNIEFFQVAFSVVSVNCVINVICLYLQYPFASEYYRKYCGGIHRCFGFILTQKATRVLMKRYQSNLDEASDLSHVEIQPMNALKKNDA